ncbi:MAG: glucose 1-dehydrogenase [Betaproteobacteria bacterium]|nr:MAG: glucose 1-dehydrogenase [Betaproteobacteria bacterium]
MELNNAVCIVTGSASGIGAASAVMLAAKGARVVVNYSKSEAAARATLKACEAAGARFGGEALLVKSDVAEDADCRRLAQSALDKWGRIDALVNNAGATKFANHADLEALSAEDFQRIYAVNVVGAYQMVRACAPAMKNAGRGAVVNVSSIAGKNGMGSSIAYAASKGALNTLTLSLARALGPEIRVNAVCPGLIDTKWVRDGYGARFAAVEARYRQGTALGRLGTPEEVAGVIVWLIEGADLVTGETIMVDSGMHMGLIPPKI